jgi:uncharacterized RDD family membrane protein YckC
MRNMLEILTPENVYVEYELAGLGSRFVAFMIDTFIQSVLILLIAIIVVMGRVGFFNNFNYEAINSIIVAVSIIVLYLIAIGYYLFFEIILKGQTPGKKLMKLRVIKQTGEPANALDLVLRNFLRFVYMIPGLHLIEVLLIVLTQNYKRIGDFAANTIVIKVEKEQNLVTIEDIFEKASLEENEEVDRINVFPVSNTEYAILKEFLARKDALGARKPVFAFNLNKYFINKFNIQKPYGNPYEFFEDIIKMNSGR